MDLWDGTGPDANGRDGEYSVFRDAGEAVRVIRAHGGAASKPPLYLHVMFQTCHSPYQVPPQYEDPSINDTVRMRAANQTGAHCSPVFAHHCVVLAFIC